MSISSDPQAGSLPRGPLSSGHVRAVQAVTPHAASRGLVPFAERLLFGII